MPRAALHATTELTKLRSPPLVFLLALIPPPLFFPKSRALSSISSARPSQLDCFDGEHPRTLLYLPQPAPLLLPAASELPTTSSRSRSYGCHGCRSRPPFPMPEVAKVEPPPPPLSSHALGFENRGRKRRPGKAPRARACGHGDAERRGNALFLSREQIKAREFFWVQPLTMGLAIPLYTQPRKKKSPAQTRAAKPNSWTNSSCTPSLYYFPFSEFN